MGESIGPKIVLEGEKEYRSALNSINKDMNVLTSEMKASAAEFDGNANSINALQKKSEILNREYDEQTKRVRTLLGALDNAKTVYGENSNQVKEWQIKLNNANAELSKFEKEIKTNNKYLDEAKSSANGTAKSIDNLGKEIKTTGDHTLKTGDVIKANLASAAVIGGVQALASAAGNAATKTLDLARGAATYADDILTMSTQTGISTDKLQAYNYMAELTDVSLQDMTSSMAKNIKSMTNAQNGSEKYANAYSKLGVAFDDGNGKLRGSEEVYWDVIDALGKITDETQRDSISMQLFGKSAQELNPLIAQGSAGVKKLADEAKNMGAVLSQDTLQSLGETDDALQRMNQSAEIAKRKFGAEIAPAVTEAAEKITAKLTDMDDVAVTAGQAVGAVADGFVWVIDNADLVISGLSGIGAAMITQAAVTGVTSAVGAFSTLAKSIKAATVAQEGFNLAQNANAIGIAVTAVAGLTTALAVYNSTHQETNEEFEKLKSDIDATVDSCNDLISQVNASKDAFTNNTTEIETNYQAAQQLSDKLFDLSDKENKSNAEKAQMQSLVNQLNSSIPNLNLVLNEQTGALSLQKSQVDGLISSYKEKILTQAYEERYLELTKEQISLQSQLKTATDSATEAEAAFSEAKKESDKVNVNNWGAVNRSKETLQGYEDTLNSAKGKVNEINSELKENATALSDAEKHVSSTGEATNKFADTTQAATKTTEKSLSDLEKAYDNAKKSAVDSIQSQIDIFEKFSDESKVTKGELLKNLERQVKGISEWADNLQSLSDRGINKGLLKDLKAMGPSAAAEIAALNSMSDKELKAYSNNWVKLGQETKKAADVAVSEQRKTYSDAYAKEQAAAMAAGEAMMASHNQGVKSKEAETGKAVAGVLSNSLTYAKSNTYAESVTVGGNIGDGIKQGVNSKGSALQAAMSGLGNDMLNAMKQAMGIHSPSQVMKEQVGEQLAAGVIQGIEAKKENAKKSASEMSEIILDAAKTKLDNYKVYNNMSLQEEIDYWNKIRSELRKGTQARIEADKEYLSAKKELADQHEELLNKQKEAEKEYYDSSKEIKDMLKSDVKDLTESYKESLNDRTEAIRDSMGLFDSAASDSDVTGRELLQNLASQVSALSNWSDNLNDLEKRGISGSLLEELRSLGANSANEVAALNSLTDSQLNEYVKLWESKSKLARKQAVDELSGLKGETTQKIQELTNQTNKDLQNYYNTYKSSMKELGVAIKEPVQQVKTTISADGDTIVANVSNAIKKSSSSSGTQSILKSAASGIKTGLTVDTEPIGKGIVAGIVTGMKAESKSLTQAARSAINGVQVAMRSAAGIHSPSTLMAETIGKPLAQGVGVGFVDNMDTIKGTMAKSIPMDFETDISTNVALNRGYSAPSQDVNVIRSVVAEMMGNFKLTAVSRNPLIVGMTELGQIITECTLEMDKLNNATPKLI